MGVNLQNFQKLYIWGSYLLIKPKSAIWVFGFEPKSVGFEPKSKGIKALLPHVDDFRTVHNLASLRDLAEALSRPQSRRLEAA